MEIKELIKKITKLKENIRKTTSHYVNSHKFSEVEINGNKIAYDIRDILLIGAIIGTDVLITGKTGSGKTELSKGVMTALFGTRYWNKTVTYSMNPSDFIDIDFKGLREGKKSLKEAIEPSRAVNYPGIVLNEINRVPEPVQALLIPFFDREFEAEGKEVPVGVQTKKGRYQYRIATINEGERYIVVRMDEAITDRAGIVIPLDMFPQYPEDVVEMLKKKKRECDPNEFNGNEKLVIEIFENIDAIPEDEKVVEFITFLSSLSNCLKSETKSKETIEFNLSICQGCHQSGYFYNLCGNIWAPSPRVLINLYKMAKGLALLRLATAKDTPEKVLMKDVIAGAPFILFRKMGINRDWVKNKFQGSEWLAIEKILINIEARFDEYMSEVKKIKNQKSQIKKLEIAKEWRERNPWYGATISELSRKTID